MSSWASERFSAAKTGWVIVAVLGAWVVFLLFPLPQRSKPNQAATFPPVAAQSKLEAVGLANNPDWAGLPEFFAIWATGLPWQNDRVRFAYWNPGSSSYSYAFEAQRSPSGVRFREIPVDQLRDGSFNFDFEEFDKSQEAAGKPESPTHPFVFPIAPLPAALSAPVISPPPLSRP